jgi:hypothetical protein
MDLKSSLKSSGLADKPRQNDRRGFTAHATRSWYANANTRYTTDVHATLPGMHRHGTTMV